MPASPRKAIVADDEVGVYHCVNRCVRRAYLCGADPLTGDDHNHRKDWIDDQLQHVASIFGIDLCGYAVMSPDAWLCELTIQEGPSQPAGPSPTADQKPDFPATTDAPATPAPSPRVPTDHAARASEQGFLPMSVTAYLSLVDWTGRQIRAGSRGSIPAELAPILDRLRLNGDGWIETVRCYGRWFKQVVGGRTSMKAFAEKIGRAWFHGQRAAAVAFLC